MQIMSMKGTSAARPAAAGQVLGPQSRVSKHPARAAGGGKRKQSGPYAGMTNNEIKRRKIQNKVDEARKEGMAIAAAGITNLATTSENNRDGGEGTALLENPQEGLDVHPDGRGQASMGIVNVQNRDGGDGTALLENPQEGLDVNPDERGQASNDLASVPSPDLESQAQSRRRKRSSDESGTPDASPRSHKRQRREK